jgi:dolichyl-phosphate beta-glucosyltransferase
VSGAAFIIPCYNEERRLDGSALVDMVDGHAGLSLILVDDGSKDGTRGLLERLAMLRPERITVLALARNGGKAEAVRQGLRAALARPASEVGTVGYLDADLSTPTAEATRLLDVLDERGAAVAIGARVALLGSDIERTASRHYLGRLFASFASLALSARVYDTQCGAKVFRRSPVLEAALEAPFLSRWAFDVELLGRLIAGTASTSGISAHDIVEVPLRTWRDVPGSKLNATAMVGSAKDLALIALDLGRRRRAAGR